ARCAQLAQTIEDKSRALTGLDIEAHAMLGHTHLVHHHAAHQEKIAALSKEINQLRAELAGDLALAEALEGHEHEHLAGEFDSPRAHIHHAAHPAPAADLRLNRVAEFWAAISIGLVMVGFVALVLFARP